MSDTVLGSAHGWAGWCLKWVDEKLNLPGWGGMSAAAAFDSFRGSAQTTTNPQPGDIVLFGSNSASSGGHAGIYAGQDAVLSVLNDDLLHLTDIPTLSSWENGGPIFVSASSLGPNVLRASQGTIADWQAEIDKIGGGTGTTGTGTGTTTTGTTTTTRTGTTTTTTTSPPPTPGKGLPGSAFGGCTPPDKPFSINITDANASHNPFDVIGYYLCVITYDIQRGLFMFIAIVIVVLGIYLFGHDKDAPEPLKVTVKSADKAGKKVASTAAEAGVAAAAA